MKRKKFTFKQLQNKPFFCLFIIFISTVIYYYQISQDNFTGLVSKVIDGDTIDILVAPTQIVRVRLAGIDAPETEQLLGQRSKEVLASLVLDKQVTIIKIDEDQYRRTVAIVKVAELNVNREMVKRGMAWVYNQYNDDPSLLLLQAQDKIDRVGIWAARNPTPPWVYRQQNQ